MKVIFLSKENFKRAVETASKVLLKGGVVVCPTDTVYGLLADATNKKAVQKVFLIKRREQRKSLPIFIKSIAMAKKLAKVDSFKEKHMKKVWPGKVTLVVESKGKLPKETGTKETIGLRIPKHKLVQEILQKTNLPLVGTSANVAGKPPLSEGEKVLAEFQKRKYQPDLSLDAGKLATSRPSQVIDIRKKTPRILRK